jgi:LysM repeat protein
MLNFRHRRLIYVSCLAAFTLYLIGLAFPVLAAPALQLTPFPTPTPAPDGRIIYVVQAGDTLWRVSAITGVSLDELRRLNNLGAEEPIIEGQELLLGMAGPAEIVPTEGPTVTPETSLPTPSPQPGSGTLCILVYNDVNGDSMHQESEPSIPGGEISISDRSGQVSLTETTTTSPDPICFEELPEGDYNISVAVPDDYNPTTVLNYALAMEPGATTSIGFGAQLSTEALVEAPGPTGTGKSPLLGILGGLILAGGLGLGFYASRLGRSSTRSLD